MQGIITLLLILSPMFVGFALPTSARMVAISERLLNYLVYLILIVIGIELGLVDDLAKKVGDIAKYLSTLMALTLGAGLISLAVYDRLYGNPKADSAKTPANQPKISLRGSLTQLVCLAVGFFCGKNLTKPSATTRQDHNCAADGVAAARRHQLKRLWCHPKTSFGE